LIADKQLPPCVFPMRPKVLPGVQVLPGDIARIPANNLSQRLGHDVG